MPRLAVETVARVADIPAAAWDACAGATNPFVSHAFLDALEASGSAVPKTGWGGSHLVVRDDAGAVVGCAPVWVKSHSWGEYVFDHPWADAYRRAGRAYYPKLLVGVPFTPVPGPRLLTADPEVRAVLVSALAELVRRLRVSSCHANFLVEEDRAAFAAAGWKMRAGFQFHWENHGYTTFDDFLGALRSHRRKELRRERRQVAASGVEVRVRGGADLTPDDWRRFHALYMAQSDRKWGQPYLTEEFWLRLGATLPDRVVLVTAHRDGETVAAALNLVGADTLYGRNWGTVVDVPGLHFEVCYHRAIEEGIARGLAKVEAGAQGEHKLQRGYLPVKTWSAHLLADPRFAAAIGEWVEHEAERVDEAIEVYASHSPYRRADEGA